MLEAHDYHSSDWQTLNTTFESGLVDALLQLSRTPGVACEVLLIVAAPAGPAPALLPPATTLYTKPRDIIALAMVMTIVPVRIHIALL